MARTIIILLSLFTLTIQVNAQFYDIFQNFQPFLQNYQTTKPEYNIFDAFSQTRPRNDQNYKHGNTQTDRRKTQTKTTTTVANFFLDTYTTAKPVRKSIKNNSSHRPESSSKNSNVVTSNQRIEDNRRQDNSNQRKQSSNEKRRQDDFSTSNNRRQTGLHSGSSTDRRQTNVDSSTERRKTNPGSSTERRQDTNRKRYDEDFNSIIYTEQPIITSRPNYVTTKRYSQNFNTYTHRPGVRPASVDTNRPPITNRPPTTRPFATYPRPTDSSAIRFPEDPDTSPEMLVGPDEDQMSSAEKRRYISLAEKMCDKFKSFNIKKVEAIPLLPSPEPVQLNVTVCPASTVPLVVGGKVVNIEEFPHMALLGWTKIQGSGYSWKCGGSLISDQYVLTAGHCAFQEKDDTVVSGGPRVVQLGSSYMDDTGALVMKVLSVVRHPKYVRPRSYYDIALVKMVRPVTFSKVVKPACLGEPPGVGESIIATGWGRTEFSGSQSLELRSVSIPIWDTDECREVLGVSRKMPEGPSRDSQICAGEKQGGKDTCQGDSGGPAQIQDGCVWRVVAVTSLGRSCGAPNTPAIYATLHRAFIAAQVFGNEEAKNSQQGNKNTNSQTSRPSTQNDRPNRNNNGNGNRGTNNQSSNSQNSNNNGGLINNQNSWNTNSQNKNTNSQSAWNNNSQNNGNTNNNNQNSWNTNSQSSGNRHNNNENSWNTNSQSSGNKNNNNENSWNYNQPNSNGFSNTNNQGVYQLTNNNYNNGNYQFGNYDNNNSNRRNGYDNYNSNDYDDYYESSREGRHKNFKSNFVTTSKPSWLSNFGI